MKCALIFSLMASGALAQGYDVIIRNGTVYDGGGGDARRVDVAIKGDRIAGLGDYSKASAKTIVNATGLAVAPGFINMLSWSTESLIQDGRSQSELRQGVTTEIMGEGESMGPLNDNMRRNLEAQQGDIKYPVTWHKLSEYLDQLVRRGISPNVASFVGATSLRIHEIGYTDRPPTPDELSRMCDLARQVAHA